MESLRALHTRWLRHRRDRLDDRLYEIERRENAAALAAAGPMDPQTAALLGGSHRSLWRPVGPPPETLADLLRPLAIKDQTPDGWHDVPPRQP